MFYEKDKLRTMLPQAKLAFGSGIGPEQTVPRNSCYLKGIGARWRCIGNRLYNHANTHNVLYAFVVDETPYYIGKTTQPLHKRMAGYRNPGPSQSTNIKNKQHICTALLQGKSVKIYVLPDNGLLHYGGFHVNLAAGLEDSLVRELEPPWNGGKKEVQDNVMKPPEPV
ncbi:MAG: GIY-YIG nuclease family protein [Chloroflexaceae bacterium]